MRVVESGAREDVGMRQAAFGYLDPLAGARREYVYLLTVEGVRVNARVEAVCGIG